MPRSARTRYAPPSDSTQGRQAGRRTRGPALVMLAALATGQGCYTYRATDVGTVAPNEEVRVTLNDRGAGTVLPGAVGTGQRTVEGRFGELKDDSLVISVWIGEAYRGTPFETTYQRVAMPRIDVLAIENRQLSKARTAIVAAGVVALIVTAIDRLGVIPIFGRGGDGGLPPPEPEGFRIRR
jgi:hypothetical protein